MASDASNLLKEFAANLSTLDSILVNLAVATFVGGLVFLVVSWALARKLHDRLGIFKAFLAVFLINIISIPVVLGSTVQVIASLPLVSIILPFLPFLIWFIVVKVVFGQLPISHAFIISLVGYLLSLFVIPALVASVRVALPF